MSDDNTMQAVIKPDRSPGLRLARMPIPDAGAREALIKVAATSICGTDLHIFKWDPWARSRINPPVIVGHEFCGYVVAVGSMVQEVQVGDFVSAESHIVCHTCAPCRTGQAHLCQNTQIIGVDRHGCWADYIVMPVENLWINTPDLPLGVASLQENFGNAVHTAFTTDLTARNVLVTGCGPVGLMTIMVAKAAGAKRIYATDISNYRLRMAGDMGADLALNVSEHRAAQVIMEDTGGDGVDVLLEMSGAPQAIDLGFSLLRFGGEAALLGLAPSAIPFDINNHIVLKGATVYGIVGRQIWGTWFRMRGLLGSGRLDLSRVITHEYTLANYEKAIRVMQNGQSGKVAMYPGGVPT